MWLYGYFWFDCHFLFNFLIPNNSQVLICWCEWVTYYKLELNQINLYKRISKHQFGYIYDFSFLKLETSL